MAIGETVTMMVLCYYVRADELDLYFTPQWMIEGSSLTIEFGNCAEDE